MGEAEGPEPRHFYVVGDTIRLRLSFDSPDNFEGVRAFYFRSASPDDDHDPPYFSRITFEGTIEETEILGESADSRAPLKRHATTLLSLVDRDHLPGLYYLNDLHLTLAGGSTIVESPLSIEGPDNIADFEIVEETGRVENFRVDAVPEGEPG